MASDLSVSSLPPHRWYMSEIGKHKMKNIVAFNTLINLRYCILKWGLGIHPTPTNQTAASGFLKVMPTPLFVIFSVSYTVFTLC